MVVGKKKQKLEICTECNKSVHPGIEAARSGHEQCLITAYRELGVFNERDNFGATPIHYAARYGHLTCLKWLVENSGVSSNAVSVSGMTAAHDAAAMGQLDCLKYLLQETRCSPDDRTLEGATVVHVACRFGRIDIVRWLVDNGFSSWDQKGGNDVTPVHLCAARDQLECLQYFLKHPDYVANQITVHGATPVYFAAQEGSLHCLQLLILNGGGDPNIPASDGMYPIHAASQAGQLDCLRWLVDVACVPIRQKAEDGATPVHFAAASGKIQCLEWLLDHGAFVSDTDNLGGTPLHDAAEQGHADALKVLLKYGGDVSQSDMEGVSPIDLAKDNQHDECLKVLFNQTSPSIMSTIVPQRPQSRSSNAEDSSARQEKQRVFEETLLSGVSTSRREEMWSEAKKNAGGVSPGLKLLLDNGRVEGGRPNLSLRGRRSGKSTQRSVSSYKDLFGEKDHSSKQRSPIRPQLFDTPPISNLDISHKAEERPVLAGQYGEMIDLVDPTQVTRKRSSFLGKENSEEEEEEPRQKKGARRSSSFLQWIKRKISTSEEVPKMKQGREQEKRAIKAGKKKSAHTDGGSSLPLELLEEHLSHEIKEHDEGKELEQEGREITQEDREVMQVDREITQEDRDVTQESKEIAQEDVDIGQEESRIKQQDKNIPVGTDVVQEDGEIMQEDMDIIAPNNTSVTEQSGTGEMSHPFNKTAETIELQCTESLTENDSLFQSMEEPEKKKKKQKPIRQASAEKVIIREGDRKDVKIDFIKLGSFYHKPMSQLHDSDFSSPEVSDTEDLRKSRQTRSRFENFGVEVGNDGIIVAPKKTLSRQLEEDFDVLVYANEGETSMMSPTSREEGVVSPLTDPNTTDIPVEVGINIDFESSDLVNISFQDKLSSTPVPSQDHVAKNTQSTPHLQSPPSLPLVSITEERGQSTVGGLERKLSVKEMASRMSGVIPMATPYVRTLSEIKRASVTRDITPISLSPTTPPDTPTKQEPVKTPETVNEENVFESVQQQGSKQEEEDVLTPLRRISSGMRKASLPLNERGRIDGIGVGSHDDKDHAPLQRTLSPHSGAMLSTFMHTSDSKYLKLVKTQHEEDQKNLAVKTAQELLQVSAPQDDFEQSLQQHVLTGNREPVVFEIPHSDNRKESVCLQVECTYPPQAHVFIHTENEIPSQEAMKMLKKIVNCVPGKPIVYREVAGHESPLFSAHFPSKVAGISKPYVNLCVPGLVQLYRFSEGKFHGETLNYFSLTEGEVFILDTPTKVFLRINPAIWEMDDSDLFAIAKDFLTMQEYPPWATVAIATKYGEPQDFTSVFPSWPHADLRLATMATQLNLPADFSASTPYPSAGRVKIWKIEQESKELILLDKFGHFDSDHCYLIEFYHSGRHELYLWVGSLVKWDEVNVNAMGVVTAHIKEASGHCQLVIIPEGREVERFLNIFKGKCIIHNPSIKGPTHLFRVAGTSALRLCAREVPPQASSLHSSHSFISYTGEILFVWSGQFSLTYERRGSLIIARMLDSDFLEPSGMIPEGQETEEFWSLIGGKGPHPFVDPSELPEYSPGRLYVHDNSVFKEKLNYTKKDLARSETCVLWKSSKLFIWHGSDVPGPVTLDVAADFVTKMCPSKSLIRDFVISMETEGKESQEFWRVFNLSQKAAEQSANRVSSTDVREESNKGPQQVVPVENQVKASEEDVHDGRTGPSKLPNILVREYDVLDVSKTSKVGLKKMQKDKTTIVVPLWGPHEAEVVVRVSVEATVGSVLLKFAAHLKMELSRDLALFEVLDELKIERQIEDHEVISDVLNTWPKKNCGHFVLREIYGKYRLWTRPSLAKNDIRDFIRKNQVPSLYGSLGFTKLGKPKWKNETLTLEHDGVYSVVLKGQGLKTGACICPIEGHNLYMPMQAATASTKTLKGVTHFSFILKPSNSFKLKDAVMFSAGDENTLKTWVEAIKLVKFGAQLKANYKMMSALLKRQEDLDKVTQADTPNPHSHFKVETSEL